MPDHNDPGTPVQRPRRFAVSGASGLIGSAVVRRLESDGHEVRRLVRRRPPVGAADVFWEPATGVIDAAGLEALDAVVHLAGENIADGRWTAERKALIRTSRVEGTRLLCEALARLRQPPRVLIAASAVGFYGDRGDEPLTEDSPPGTGFLPEVCTAWEAATEPAQAAGIRVVNLRIGVVLSAAGGALARMLPALKSGLGGRVGNGRQYMSWIWLGDLVAAIGHLIDADGVAGPVNGVAPNPVTNAEFVETLGRLLHRPALVPLPAFMVRLLFGEMGQTLLLEGCRVLPARLQSCGFSFAKPDVESALRTEIQAESAPGGERHE